MRLCLLLFGIVVLLTVGGPAHSQYIYMDTNGDGICTLEDYVTDVTTSVDIWLDTNHNAAGGTVACSDGVSPLDMLGYDVIIHNGGGGSVTYTGWTNAMANWTALEAFRTSGADASVGYIAPGAAVAPGKYKLGSFAVTVSGAPYMGFLTDNSTLGGGAPVTGFGSDCSGTEIALMQVLSVDFRDACGAGYVDDVLPTTWGAIKTTYR